jgi:hypothetical protein
LRVGPFIIARRYSYAGRPDDQREDERSVQTGKITGGESIAHLPGHDHEEPRSPVGSPDDLFKIVR